MIPEPAYAANECGPPPPAGGTVTCPPSGNPYPGGITYDPVVEDLTVVLEPGVVVTGGVEIGTGLPDVNLALDGAPDTDISSSADGRDGVNLQSIGGDLTIATDSVATTGDNAVGIRATTKYGSITIDSGTVTTTGLNSSGIDARVGGIPVDEKYAGGPILITSDSVTTSGEDAAGIHAENKYGPITIDSGTVLTSGLSASGIVAISTGGIAGKYSGGPIQIISDSLTTEGNASTGIFAETDGGIMNGDITIDSGSILTRGTGSTGIVATAVGGGHIVIDSTDIVTQNDFAAGIVAISDDGGIDIENRNSITTNGDDSPGIVGIDRSEGDVTITSLALSTAGDDSNGITGLSPSGDVTIDSDLLTTLGDNSIGILAQTVDGAVNITSGSVETSGADSIGILARTGPDCICVPPGPPPSEEAPPGPLGAPSSGDIVIAAAPIAVPPDVSITSGSVTTGGDGAYGIAAYTSDGDIYIESGEVTTGGAGATGILADSEFGSVTIDSGTVGTTGDDAAGIYATANGTILVTSDSVTTGGVRSVGIAASSYIGGVTVDSGTVETSQDDAVGIAAESDFGAVSVTSDSVETAGDFAIGIAAGSKYGAVGVDSGTVTTSGDFGVGIAALSQGESVLVESGSVQTSGASAVGILAGSKYGGVEVTSTTVVTTGDDAIGIFALAGTGSKYGGGGDEEITPSGLAALAVEDGGVSIISGSVSTTGDDAHGIAAYGETVTIASTTVTTSGDNSTGILARAFDVDDDGKYSEAEGISVQQVGPGGVLITSGSVTTSGAGSPGIDGLSPGGDVEIVSTGTVTTTGADSPGIVATSDTGFVIIDSANLNVSGAGSDGIVATSDTTTDITIRGLNRSTQGFTIQADGGAATVGILGGGTVRGRVDLTDDADTLNNAGGFDAIGTSLFGAGTDVFNNNAGGVVSSFNGAAGLAGLETFNNRNRVEMRDSAVGDTLNISGTYNGLAGARLGVDVDFAAELADVLILGPATGSTLIDVNTVALGFNLNPILVVDASAGTLATAFSLAGGNVSNGYVLTRLIFDAPNFNFLLVADPEQPVFETSKIGQVGTNIWYLGADALAAQLEGARDGGQNGANGGSALAQESASGTGRNGFGFWVQGVLGDSEMDGLQTFNNTVFDVGYEQDYLGVQGGFDYRMGITRFGITFGMGKADSTFLASGNTLDVDDQNVGLYVALETPGGVFFNALAKMDWLDLDLNPGPGLEAEFDGRAFGFQANGGVKFAMGNLFAEPSVGISWVNTDFDEIVSGPATIRIEDVRSMRARAGLRIGGDFAMGSGTLSPFAGVQLMEELEGDNVTQFVLGQTLTLVDQPPGSRALLSLGTSYEAGAFEAFLRGDLDFGDEDGKSIRAGVRLRF